MIYLKRHYRKQEYMFCKLNVALKLKSLKLSNWKPKKLETY